MDLCTVVSSGVPEEKGTEPVCSTQKRVPRLFIVYLVASFLLPVIGTRYQLDIICVSVFYQLLNVQVRYRLT